MPTRTKAIKRLRAYLDDEVGNLLHKAQLPNNLEAALRDVPVQVLQIDESSGRDPGELTLIRIRDHWSRTNKLQPALAATRYLVKRRAAELGGKHPNTLLEKGGLGALASRAGLKLEALTMLQEAYDGLVRQVERNDLRLAVVAAHYARYYLKEGNAERAEQLLRQSLDIRKAVAPRTAGLAAAQLGEVLLRRDKIRESVPFFREALENYRDVYGAGHPRTVTRARALAVVLKRLGWHRDAEPVLRELYELAHQKSDPARQAEAGFELGISLDAAGEREEGLRLVEEALRKTQQAGSPHPALSNRLSAYARILMQRGRASDAEGHLLEALEADRTLHGEASTQVALRYADLGQYYAFLGRTREALGWLDVSTALLRSIRGGEDRQTVVAAESLLRLIVAQAKDARARRDEVLASQLIGRANEIGVKILGFGHPLMHDIRLLEEGG